MPKIRYLSAALAAAALLVGASPVLAQHNAPAQTIVCAGDACGVARISYSVESTSTTGDGSKVNCPQTGECYNSYDDSQRGSSGWGPTATPVGPAIPKVGPVQLGGVALGTSASAARAWTGLCADGGGCGSVAVAGGRNTSGHAFFCVTAYGADGTSGGQISKALNDAGISDDRTDLDSDGQVCGTLLEGAL